MAIYKIKSVSFAAAFAMLLIIAATSQSTEARKFIGVNKFCRTSSYRMLCTRMVRGATTQDDATMNAIKSALVLAKKIKDLVPPKNNSAALHGKPAKDPEVQRESVLDICRDQTESVVDDLETSMEAFKANDIGTVRSHLSGGFRTDCQDTMEEIGVKFPFSKYLGLMERNIDNCLAVLMQD